MRDLNTALQLYYSKRSVISRQITSSLKLARRYPLCGKEYLKTEQLLSESKKFPTFYGIRQLITAFTTPCHLFLSPVRSLQSKHLRHVSLIFILTLSFLLRLGLPIGLFPSGWAFQNPVRIFQGDTTQFVKNARRKTTLEINFILMRVGGSVKTQLQQDRIYWLGDDDMFRACLAIFRS